MNNINPAQSNLPLVNILTSKNITDQAIQSANEAANKLFALKVAYLSANSNLSNAQRSSDLTYPELTRPKSLNPSSQLTLLIGNLIQILGDNSLHALAQKISSWQSLLQAREQKNIEYSDKINSLHNEVEKLIDEYGSKIDSLKSIESQIKGLDANLEKLEKHIATLEKNSPDYNKAIQEKQKLLEKKEVALKDKENLEKITIPIHNNLTNKANKLEAEINSLSSFTKESTAQQLSTQHKSLTGLASVTQLMATFIQLVGKNNEESLKNDLALFQSLQDARKVEMEKKSDEYAAEVRKAEELNKVMGCIGKILGALLTVVSVIAAAFTGGASLAIAAVGLALMAADTIVQAATGTSFMEQALNPLMKGILEPLMKFLSDAFTKMLEGLGVDSKTAQMVGSILGAIAGAAVLVAAVVVVALVGKQAAAKLADKIGQMIGKTISQLIPKFLKNMSSQLDDVVSNAVTRLNKFMGTTGDDVITKQLVSTRLNQVVVIGEGVQTTTQAGGNIASATFQYNAAKDLSELTLSKSQVEQLSKYMRDAIEKFAQLQEVIAELLASMSDSQTEKTEVARAILKQTTA